LTGQELNRNRDRFFRERSGRPVTIRVDLLIITALLLSFILVSIHTFNTLKHAFKEVYSQKSSDVSPVDPKIVKTINPGPVFHREYFSPQVARWEDSILLWAEQHGLPPDLIAIVMQIESCGDQLARSSAGAMGVFQVMPFHFSVEDNAFDPQINAARGLDYLARGYTKSGKKVELALAGYNGGHTMIDTPSNLWPAETRRYVIWGSGIWEDIRDGRHPSPTLEQWLKAGGSHLCSAASATAIQTRASN
jgi:hypothetical protein